MCTRFPLYKGTQLCTRNRASSILYFTYHFEQMTLEKISVFRAQTDPTPKTCRQHHGRYDGSDSDRGSDSVRDRGDIMAATAAIS